MPSVDLYLDQEDGTRLREWLNREPDVAFVFDSSGERVSLVDEISDLTEGKFLLFHRSYDSVPVHSPLSRGEEALSAELYSAMSLSSPVPLSGPDENHPAIFTLSVCYSQPVDTGDAIGLSQISWIGGRYSSLGREPTPEASRWWRRASSWIVRNGQRISRFGPLYDYPRGFWACAFPSALASIEAGAARADNNAS